MPEKLIIGEELWAWIKRVEEDRKPYPLGGEWQKIELALKQETHLDYVREHRGGDR